MKRNLLAVMFMVAYLSGGAAAQQVFIPTPPVVYIPQLDPVRMFLEQQLFRDNMNAEAAKESIVNGKKVRVPAKNSGGAAAKTAANVTAFSPASERILPARLSRAAGGNHAAIRQARETFDMFLNNYYKTALNDNFPPHDLAYGLSFFIVNNYIVYKDLQDKSPHDKALMSPSGDPLLALQRTYSKQAQTVTPGAERAVYRQIKTILSANPAVAKLTDLQKQEFTEMLAIITVANYYTYETAGKNKDADAFAESQKTARQALEKMLGVPAEKIKITENGLEF